MRKALAFLILFCILSPGCVARSQKICFTDTCISAEIADTPEKKRQGLMFRKSLDETRGMLFIYPYEVRPVFWMKNMRFPIDILWIDKDKIVVDIRISALPCNDVCIGLVPERDVRYVVEVNAGFADRHQIRIGDKVNF